MADMARAQQLDREDPLSRWRDEFHLPAGRIYLDGNSLGPAGRRAEAKVQEVLAAWRDHGIDGWLSGNAPWLTLADDAARAAAPLVGAETASVAVTGQTTSNLHQLLATLYNSAHSTRRVIVGDALNFASDTHALRSHLRLRGLNPEQALRTVPSRDGRILWIDDILNALTEDVQLLVLPAVVFTSGQLLDVTTITRKARERGVMVLWDLSHSIGAVPHALDRDGVDGAFWCHYKWLNAGPGAVGGLYLNHRHFDREPGLAGWWGVRPERRFAMAPVHERAAGAAGLHVGTPHILSLAPLLGSLEVIATAGGVGVLRDKSLALTSFLLEASDARLAPLGFKVVTPRSAHARGGHVALAHPEGWRICQALKAQGVVPDFRAPDIIRLAPSPLFTRFTECLEAVERLRQIVSAGAHLGFPGQQAKVT